MLLRCDLHLLASSAVCDIMSGSDNEGFEGEDSKLPPALRTDPDAKTYIYRDFADLPEDPENVDSPPPKRGNSESSIRVQKFPVKLYAILLQKEFSDIITWMPHGRSWKVLKPNLFETLVMPLFFEYSNYHSFNRLVNAWSFRRISSGTDRGSYYHELFLRGKPHLQKYMRRLPKTHKKLVMRKEDEPDFYKMDKTNPLPQLEESPENLLEMRRQAMEQAAALQTAPPSYAPAGASAAAAIAANPSLTSTQWPGATAAYPGPLVNRPMSSLGGMDQAAAARFGALDTAPPSIMSSLGATSPLPSMGTLGPTFSASFRGRASLGMPLPATLRAPALPPIPPPDLPPSGLDPATDSAVAQHYQYLRMRHLQHLQLFQRQMMGTSTGAASPAAAAATSSAAADEALLRQYYAQGGAATGRGIPPYM